MKKFLKTLCVFILIFTFCIFPSIFAQAQAMSLKITPLTYKFSIEKGKSESSVISVINPNQIDINVVAEIEDFLQGDEEGTPKFIKNEEQNSSLADWIKIDLSEITLKPNEKRDINFEISPPMDAQSGGHYAAIFFRVINTQTTDNNLGVAGRVGSLILLTIPGDISMNGEIIEFSTAKYYQQGPINFLARFKNNGTNHFQTAGTIKIKNMFGKEVARLDLPEHIILPDSIRRFESRWYPSQWSVGQYKALLEIKDGDGIIRTSGITFYIFPWKIVLALLIGIVLLVVIMVILKKGVKQGSRSTIPPKHPKC
jgi:hypothetical protein